MPTGDLWRKRRDRPIKGPALSEGSACDAYFRARESSMRPRYDATRRLTRIWQPTAAADRQCDTEPREFIAGLLVRYREADRA